MPLFVGRSNAKRYGRNQGAVRSIDMPSARITCNFSAIGPVKTGAQSKPGGEQFSEPNRSQRTY